MRPARSALLARWWCVCCKWMTWKQRSNWQSPRCWDSSRLAPDNRFPFVSIKIFSRGESSPTPQSSPERKTFFSRHLRLFKFVTLSLLLPQWFSLRVWWIWSNTCERNGNFVFDMRESLRFIRVVYLKQWLSVQLKQRGFFFFLHHHPFQLWLTNNYHDKKRCELAEKNHLRCAMIHGARMAQLGSDQRARQGKSKLELFAFLFASFIDVLLRCINLTFSSTRKSIKFSVFIDCNPSQGPRASEKSSRIQIHSESGWSFSRKTFSCYATKAGFPCAKTACIDWRRRWLSFRPVCTWLPLGSALIGRKHGEVRSAKPTSTSILEKNLEKSFVRSEKVTFLISRPGFEIDLLKIKSREHFSSSHHSSSMLNKQHTEEEPSSTRMWNVAANLSIPHTKLTHTPTPLTFFMLCFCYRCCFIVIVHAHRRAGCHLAPHPRDSPSSRVQLLIINCESRVLRLFLFMLSLIPRVFEHLSLCRDRNTHTSRARYVVAVGGEQIPDAVTCARLCVSACCATSSTRDIY